IRLNASRKASIKTKRLLAATSDEYRAELLGFEPQDEEEDDD
ncbi:ISAs1 family transposase, partial [Denitromonas sp. IR12]|nr:ISAs1 family transposase [Denitromonas iodatirespirans]